MGIVTRELIKDAKKAGKALYGDSLEWKSISVSFGTVKGRILEGLENDTDPDVVLLVDDYEFAFTSESVGIEASGMEITDKSLHENNYLFLYDPEHGVQALRVDITTEEAKALIRNF